MMLIAKCICERFPLSSESAAISRIDLQQMTASLQVYPLAETRFGNIQALCGIGPSPPHFDFAGNMTPVTW
jgi:hypothetical protein